MALGLSDREIACAMNISLGTIHSNTESLKNKTGVQTKQELREYAIVNGYGEVTHE